MCSTRPKTNLERSVWKSSSLRRTTPTSTGQSMFLCSGHRVSYFLWTKIGTIQQKKKKLVQRILFLPVLDTERLFSASSAGIPLKLGEQTSHQLLTLHRDRSGCPDGKVCLLAISERSREHWIVAVGSVSRPTQWSPNSTLATSPNEEKQKRSRSWNPPSLSGPKVNAQ